MSSSILAPAADPYLGTNVIDNQNDSVAWEVADFLFGAKSIKNIAEGNGTWGDAAILGITAATFLIPPAKIALLGNKALRKVLAETIVVNASTNSLPVVAKAVAKTRAEVEAELIRRGKLSPTERMKELSSARLPASEARFKNIMSPEPPYKFVPEGPPVDKYNPRNQGLTRKLDEDYDPFLDRDVNPAQEADDYIVTQGLRNQKKLLTKEELNIKDIESSQYYDKRKFTEDEIEERFNRLSDDQKKMLKDKSPEEVEDFIRSSEYTSEEIQGIVERLIKDNKDAADIDAKEVASIYFSLIRIIESQKIKKTLSPEELKNAQKSLKDLEKEFEEKIVDAVEGEAILKKYESNLPDQQFAQKREVNAKGSLIYEKGDIKPTESLVRFQDDISDNAKLGKSESIVDEVLPDDMPTSLKPGTETISTKKVFDPEVVAIKVPLRAKMDLDLREGLSMPAQKFAELQAEIRKLEIFNKANTNKKRGASESVLQDLKRESDRNLELIQKYQKQLLILKKAIPEEELVKAIKVSEEISRRAIERLKNPFTSSGLFTDRYARPAKTYTSGVPLTRKEKIAKEKAKIEKLRKEWQTIPAWETEAKSKLKEEAKKSADYIKRLEADAEKFVLRETKGNVTESAGSVVKWTDKTDKTVYIGRDINDPTGRGRFGNPFEVGKDPDNFTVEQAVAKYGKWLKDKIKTNPDYADEIYSLKGKEIGCPGKEPVDQCHGTVILKAIKYLDENPQYLGDASKATKSSADALKPIKSFDGKVSEVTVHSGMASGSDTVWAEVADSMGIKTVGHSYKNHGKGSNRPALETRNELTEEQLKAADPFVEKAAKGLGRPIKPDNRNLFRRNYYQVKDSEAVVAISSILPGGTKVDGGTGWAVQMGIDKGIPVYVFDQKVKLWAVWNGSKFEKLSGLPPKFKEFAGVGSRELTEDGRKAIEEYMQQYVSRGTTTKAVESTASALKPIDSFKGTNQFLSNMSESSFRVGQETYPTVEHFFQAMKTTNPTERAKILAAKTPAEAKRIGGRVQLPANWSKIKLEVMEVGLRAKFQQNPELKKKLIDTGDADLIEGNTWGDTYWGQVDGKGENNLGKLLMKIRKALMEGK